MARTLNTSKPFSNHSVPEHQQTACVIPGWWTSAPPVCSISVKSLSWQRINSMIWMMKDLVGSLSTHGSQDTDMYDERLCLLFLCRINSYRKMTWTCQHNLCSQQTIVLCVYTTYRMLLQKSQFLAFSKCCVLFFVMFQAVVQSVDHITQFHQY